MQKVGEFEVYRLGDGPPLGSMADAGRARACVEVGEIEVHEPGDRPLPGFMAVTESVKRNGDEARKNSAVLRPTMRLGCMVIAMME